MKRSTLITSIVLLAAIISAFPANAQIISYYENHTDGSPDGLSGTYGVTVSADNNHVYTGSSTDDAVVVFSRNNTTGALTHVETILDDAQIGGTIAGLEDVRRLVVAPDGGHVYAPTSRDDAIVVFSRNATTGELTFVETQFDGAGSNDGLDGAHEVVVSPDNNHVYAVGYVDDMVSVWSRNTTTGALTFVETHQDGVGGVDGLNNARGICISADGNHVYIASGTDDAVAVFSRNSGTGALTFVEAHFDGAGGVDGLNGAYGITESPDGSHIYVASYNDDAVAVFSRNAGTGALTFVEVHKDDSQTLGTIDGLNAARHVIVTPDGGHVYVVTSSDHAIVVFSRDASTGELTYVETHTDGAGGIDGINGARYLAMSTDVNSLYTVSTGDDAIAVFEDVATLPIELTAFDAELTENNTVALQWTTAAEINNDYFTVERSTDGRAFVSVAEVAGAGNSSVALNYTAYDEQPAARLNYYRLKQTDFDGTFTYSPIVAVEVPFAATGDQLSVYPNPATQDQDVYVRLAGFDQQEVLVVVQDIFGRQLYSKVVVTGSFGTENVVAIDPDNRLTSGTYIITGSANDTLFSKKLVIR